MILIDIVVGLILILATMAFGSLVSILISANQGERECRARADELFAQLEKLQQKNDDENTTRSVH